MAPSLTKVIYKPDSQSTDEYIIIVNPEELKKWKEDTTTPLADVVDSFSVFHSNQGSQGLLRQPSKQQLETVFGTSKDVDVVTFILTNGKDQHGDAISSTGTMNISRGSLDSRSKGSSGI